MMIRLQRANIENWYELGERCYNEYNRILPGNGYNYFTVLNSSPYDILVPDFEHASRSSGLAEGRQEPLYYVNMPTATVQGMGFNGDIGRHLGFANAVIVSSQPHHAVREITLAYARALANAYKMRRGMRAWAAHPVYPGREGPYNGFNDSLRGALIAVGLGTLDNWRFLRPFQEMGVVDHQREHARVRSGRWYLERAKNNIDEMAEPENWAELMEEDEETGQVLRLFGLRE